MGDWKGVRQRMLGKKPNLDIELYNLAEDIGETKNVAAQHPNVVATIRRIMNTDRTVSGRFPFPVLDAMAKAGER
jgi:arylsulfatase